MCRTYRAGDLLLFLGDDPIGRAIARVTCPPWYWPEFRRRPHWRFISHVAVCCDWHSQTLLIESTTFCDRPCLIRGKVVAGMQAHFPWARAAAHVGPIWRLRPAAGWALTNEQRNELARFVHYEFDQPYDLLGALRAPTRWPAIHKQQGRFCDDFAAAFLQRAGLMAIANPKGFTPSSLAKKLIANGNFDPPIRLK
ncbi:MAG: hypothetical protein K2Y37_14735 [Pirellulales bacterium]|nr:hypothetical protein [Pirellulales bacterium]